MSYKALNWAFAAKMDDATAKSVLVALANDADKDSWKAYPAVDRLKLHTALQDRAIQGALKRLIGWGAVSPDYRPSKSTIYTLNKDWTGPAANAGNKRAPNPASNALTAADAPRSKQRQTPHLTTINPAANADDPLREPFLSKNAAASARAIGAIESVWPDLQTDLAFPGLTGSLGMVTGWISEGADLERDVLPAISAVCMRLKSKGQGPPRTMSYFARPIADTKAANEQGLPDGQTLSPSYHAQQSGHRNGWAQMAATQLRKAGKPDAL